MKQTGTAGLVGLALAGAVLGFLLELALAAASLAVLVPPLSLPITLIAIGGIVIGFAIPVRRATHGKATRPLDPFRAMRVAVLAKASSLSGSLLTGIALGLLLYLLSRSVIPSSAVWLAVATTVGAVALLVAGLLAERMCTLPPGSDRDDVKESSA
ncbi:MAG: DUF3180 domain-containing protein [Microbacteriaceae bacterium]